MISKSRAIGFSVVLVALFAQASLFSGSGESVPAQQEKQEYLDRLSAANQRYSKGGKREAIAEWQSLRSEALLPSTWGKVTFNLGIVHKQLEEYDDAIRAFESIFPSEVDDQEPGEHIMEEFRNYRYRACLQISSCYQLKGDVAHALEYVRMAREKFTYQAHCGNCASDAAEALKRWADKLEAEEKEEKPGQPGATDNPGGA